jgi:AAA domain, putative AbiEii toxin, Type IV TA system
MLIKAEFHRFRGFEGLTADLAPHAYVVGPNSAGKSTILEAIALAERCLQRARRQRPQFDARHGGEVRKAYALPSLADDDEGEDPVRFDFGTSEAVVVVRWATGASLHMVWPEQDDDRDTGFFYLMGPGGTRVRQSDVATLFSRTAVLPVVTPLERIEELKDAKYIRRRSWTRLASRHFRNHALLMQRDGEWENFKAFADLWLPEIHLLDVVFDPAANRLGVFYSEPGSRVPKELAWAGDGVQIWVQLLWHLYRARASETIVLDEPEVYLHPDLQRRLVRLLDGTSAQIVLASHSADVVAEAPADGVLWVDRRRGQARRAKSQAALSALSTSLGSSYNLHLARTTRTQLVVATDCQDLRVLRSLARQVGALFVADELRVSMVQLQDIARWSGTERMGHMLREALTPSLPAVVLLQGGQRTAAGDEALHRQLAAPNNTVLIWQRAELENYLLDPDVIARACGADPDAIADRTREAISHQESAARSAYAANSVRSALRGDSRAALEEAEREFDELWKTEGNRLSFVRGSEVLQVLNEWSEREGYKLISAHQLAKSLPPHSVPAEVFNVLLTIDERVG